MKAMIDLDTPVATLAEEVPSILTRVTGEMGYFPLCCSTGVLKNFTSHPIQANMVASYEDCVHDTLDFSGDKFTFQLIRKANAHPRYIMPFEFARHYAMSLIYLKVLNGKDDGPNDGYGHYKAAQIVMFDRLLEDKDPKKGFKFTYNMTYSIDHFQEWLSEQNGAFGEVLLSTAVPGGHGARVRGCIFTPDLKALEAYEARAFEEVKGHFDAIGKYWAKKAPKTPKAQKTKPSFASTANKIALAKIAY